jgi:hypothetical protein
MESIVTVTKCRRQSRAPLTLPRQAAKAFPASHARRRSAKTPDGKMSDPLGLGGKYILTLIKSLGLGGKYILTLIKSLHRMVRRRSLCVLHDVS